MQILTIIYDSVVDGPGVRTVLFMAGCPHRCIGCHNPSSWDASNGVDVSIEEVMRVIDRAGWGNVTISGGEPFLQLEALHELVTRCKAMRYNVWVYTGYTIEQLASWDHPLVSDIFKSIHVLVDGKFIETKRDESLSFRGSTNQRIIQLNS